MPGAMATGFVQGMVDANVAYHEHLWDNLDNLVHRDLRGVVRRQGSFIVGWSSESGYRAPIETAIFGDGYRQVLLDIRNSGAYDYKPWRMKRPETTGHLHTVLD